MSYRLRPAERILAAMLFSALVCAGGCSGTPSEEDLGKKLVPPPKEVESKPAPDVYQVKLETSDGDVIIEVNRDWAPRGADRFYTLVKIGFYDNCRFFRVIDGFMAQCGMNGDPRVMADWDNANIKDDPVKQSNLRGFVTFAKTGMPNSRSTQFFINYRDNSNLDRDGFAPFGRVIKGMDVVDGFFSGYGEGAPDGRGPSQNMIKQEGNAYLKKNFPQLDYIIKASIHSAGEKAAGQKTSESKTKPNGKKKTGA